jgi:hypothetical protein
MGYTTDFTGQFTFDKPLASHHLQYLKRFSDMRHMKRDVKKLEQLEDPDRIAVGLPLGVQGEFFVGIDDGNANQDMFRHDGSILDHNNEPGTQPGLWCDWVPDDDGVVLEWNGGEKFYRYIDWLEYLIANFIDPWGYVLNGEVEWRGEDKSDVGKIIVKDNTVIVMEGVVVFKKVKG